MTGPRLETRPGDVAWTDARPLFAAVWPPEVLATLPWGHVVFARAQQRVLAWNDAGELVGHVGLHRRDGRWDGQPVTIAGIGGVITRQDSRRQGIAGMAIREALAAAEAAGRPDFALLFCEPHNFAFYEGLGWRRFAGAIFAEHSGSRTRFEVMAPYVLDMARAPRGGEIDLCGLPW